VSADFVAAMEDVLDLYEEPPDLKRPRVCFDETPKLRRLCPPLLVRSLATITNTDVTGLAISFCFSTWMKVGGTLPAPPTAPRLILPTR